MVKKAKSIANDNSGVSSSVSGLLSTDPATIKRIPRREKSGKAENLKWWLAEEDNIANSVTSIVTRIENSQMSRRQNFVKFARFYGNWEALGWTSNSMLDRNNQSTNNHLRLNVIQSVIDA